MHAADGLVGRSIQTFKSLVLANLEPGHNLEENVSRASWQMRFTRHTTRKRTPFKMQYGLKLLTVLTKTYHTKPTHYQIGIIFLFQKIQQDSRNRTGTLTDHIVIPEEKVQSVLSPRKGSDRQKERELVQEEILHTFFQKRTIGSYKKR